MRLHDLLAGGEIAHQQVSLARRKGVGKRRHRITALEDLLPNLVWFKLAADTREIGPLLAADSIYTMAMFTTLFMKERACRGTIFAHRGMHGIATDV